MKIYKSQSAVEKDIKDGVLNIKESVTFECKISTKAEIIVDGDINAWNIDAGNINARDIDAGNINARDIDAWNTDARNINARDINARDIDAWNIDARNINARDIDAGDIDARNIDARDIMYYAFCCVHDSILCASIKEKKEVHAKPICLDGELKFKTEEK